METGSLQKHSSSSRKLGRQEGDGALGSLGLGAGKSKLKDKLSAIRQDRAERRESLQKQDAIHEVDSSEDETDEGSEDSQEGRRGGPAFTPPPLLRPTTVRTGPGGTLPSLCLSPCTSHATFSHAGPSHAAEPRPALGGVAEEEVGPDGRVPGASGGPAPRQRPLPFATPGSAFISVSKDAVPRPPAPDDPASPPGAPAARRSSCSSPGVSKEKKEADNRRLSAAAGPAAATGTKSVLGPLRLATANSAPEQNPSGAAAEPASPAPPPPRRIEPVCSLTGASAPPSPAARPGADPRTPAASEPRPSDAVTAVLAAAAAAAAVSSQQDKAVSKKT